MGVSRPGLIYLFPPFWLLMKRSITSLRIWCYYYLFPFSLEHHLDYIFCLLKTTHVVLFNVWVFLVFRSYSLVFCCVDYLLLHVKLYQWNRTSICYSSAPFSDSSHCYFGFGRLSTFSPEFLMLLTSQCRRRISHAVEGKFTMGQINFMKNS